MPKPIMNLADVEFDDVEEKGIYTSSRGQISGHIGERFVRAAIERRSLGPRVPA